MMWLFQKTVCKSPIPSRKYNDNIDIGDLSLYSRLIDPPPARIRPMASTQAIVHQNSKSDKVTTTTMTSTTTHAHRLHINLAWSFTKLQFVNYGMKTRYWLMCHFVAVCVTVLCERAVSIRHRPVEARTTYRVT